MLYKISEEANFITTTCKFSAISSFYSSYLQKNMYQKVYLKKSFTNIKPPIYTYLLCTRC